jgi:hypothetical protein
MLIVPGSARWPGAFVPRRGRSSAWSRILGPREAGLAHQPGSCCGCGGAFTCGSCSIPTSNLTISFDNLIIGPGSATLVYTTTPVTAWKSACVNQLIYELLCTGGQPELRVIYFLSGSCPTGQSQYCSTIGSAPYGLTRTSLTCGASFLMTASLTSSSCPTLATFGYTDFTVSV